MTQKKVEYLSYLLRLWRENGDEGSQGGVAKGAWRVSLETPSGESHGFASLDDLVGFLRRQIGTMPDLRAENERRQAESHRMRKVSPANVDS
jgi:hypothetical protein